MFAKVYNCQFCHSIENYSKPHGNKTKTIQQVPLFVYVIGLHAVRFGNNWMRKIGLVQFGSPRNFFNPIILFIFYLFIYFLEIIG